MAVSPNPADVIADNIIRLRKAAHMSQDDVAASLQTMGINYTRGRLSMIETKKRREGPAVFRRAFLIIQPVPFPPPSAAPQWSF